MDSTRSTEITRHMCAACFRKFNRKEHLVDHMRTSFHSVHEPKCGVCKKHCRSYESLREHLCGSLPRPECNNIFNIRGCKLCLAILESPAALRFHRDRCQLSSVNPGRLPLRLHDLRTDYGTAGGPKVVALACKRIGGGAIYARVCMIDEHENIIFHCFVKSLNPNTNCRDIRPDSMTDALPFRQVQTKIQDFLCNGEPGWRIQPGGKARILVGHGLDSDLGRLGIQYPAAMLRDTEKYPPFVKSNKQSEPLKNLTRTFLGYEIQTSNPYEDCVAAMRLYKKMRSQAHAREDHPLASDPQNKDNFSHGRNSELERMTPQQLFCISRSDYYCWCLDS